MRALTVTLLLLVGALLVPAAGAAGAETPLTLTASSGYAGLTVRLTATLVDGDPVPGAAVTLQRRGGGAWNDLATAVTDADGVARFTAERAQTDGGNRFRVVHDDLVSPVAVSTLVRRSSTVRLGGDHTVVDETSALLRIRWRTASGEPVPGVVRLQRRDSGGRWTTDRTVRTDEDGAARVRVGPRVDITWRAVARGLDWVRAATSAVHHLDNRPSGTPVRLPGKAPRPRVQVPRQQRAVGDGAHPVVSRIPDGVWRQMTGRTWHAGCPVGRAGLRLVRVNYWGYDGYRYRGELVAATGAAGAMAAALADLYRQDLPLRSLYRVDRFGWSAKLQGGNDYRSMAAGNSSAFNCRSVVNRPGVRSPHAYGRALDLNTWENPYRSATGLVPNSWWQGHIHSRVAWRSRSHRVVRTLVRHGFRWTYGVGDSQHFDYPARSGRVVAPRACRSSVCG